MLLLFAAGLALVLGIMNLVNLAHGSLYMISVVLPAPLGRGEHRFETRPLCMGPRVGAEVPPAKGI
jgi:branched-subunit amino acid ABC-type transport system permease component